MHLHSVFLTVEGDIMLVISGSVGKGGKNHPFDVKKIQEFLNASPAVTARLALDGRFGALTYQAILQYQMSIFHEMRACDGLIEPSGPTIRAMSNPHTRITKNVQPQTAQMHARAQGGHMETDDTEIEALNLGTTARAAAYELKKAHPSVKFTSGRRSKEDQARAMSGNVVQNRKWIEQTYAQSDLRTSCQTWVDNNPNKKTAAEIKAGLLEQFNAVPDNVLARFSKHLGGEAFDVQPVDKDATAIKATIRGLTGVSKFLEHEGGLVRWHVEF
jgi:hypothetical protein